MKIVELMKRIKWKLVLGICGWILAVSGTIMLMSFVSGKQDNLTCKQVDVFIDRSVNHDFISRSEIEELIHTSSKIVNKPMASINTSLLEKTIMSNPFIERTEVYSTVDGILKVNILQRNPLVRIINMHDEQFYIDGKGKFMPVSDSYSTPVMVANGFIFDHYSLMKVPAQPVIFNREDTAGMADHILKQIYDLAAFIEADTFWNAHIEQIYVNQQQELEIIPRIGSHRIIIGNNNDVAEKFQRLYIFYSRGLSMTGWNNYSVINLKFRKQVVCTKIN